MWISICCGHRRRCLSYSWSNLIEPGYLKFLDCSKEDLPSMPYRRKLPVESLSQVENPWKGITLNRCIALAMIIVVVSSSVEQVQEALDTFLEEEDGLSMTDGTNQPGSLLWDTLAFWNWGLEDDTLKRRSIRKKIHKRDPTVRLLREKSVLEALDGDD
ncbi:hypothetical protein AALO_G00124910 [Alosa alosa]|uniref:Uncharacterized protein n=2 Tax=Alosa alosa TaxID=278164 RepID=A0AAV6GLY7_9TELE|nr:uncharacterized protein LOC125300136 isoform X1 [Alosa alosa]KAG5275819.1 hypothetical protein AALO_G00124910 [Alosa alosa]